MEASNQQCEFYIYVSAINYLLAISYVEYRRNTNERKQYQIFDNVK